MPPGPLSMAAGSFLLVITAKHSGFYTITPKEQGPKERTIEMALTRKLLKGMGLTEEQVDTIIDAHTETVEGIKKERDTYKADASELQGVKDELTALKAAGDDGYKAKYEAEKKAFDTYKSEQTAKETRAAKEKAVRAYYESKDIKGNNLEIAVKGSHAEIDGIELDGEKIKDTAALDALVGGTFSGLVSTKPSFDWSAPVGAGTQKPGNNDTMNALIRSVAK